MYVQRNSRAIDVIITYYPRCVIEVYIHIQLIIHPRPDALDYSAHDAPVPLIVQLGFLFEAGGSGEIFSLVTE